jgi:hypothetical protein
MCTVSTLSKYLFLNIQPDYLLSDLLWLLRCEFLFAITYFAGIYFSGVIYFRIRF